MDINNLGRLICGTLLVAGGGVLWALTGAGEAGAAMIGAGGAMLPGAIANARTSAA